MQVNLFNIIVSIIKIAYHLRPDNKSCSASVYLFLAIKEQAVLNANSKLLVALTRSESSIPWTSDDLPAITRAATEFISMLSTLEFWSFW